MNVMDYSYIFLLVLAFALSRFITYLKDRKALTAARIALLVTVLFLSTWIYMLTHNVAVAIVVAILLLVIQDGLRLFGLMKPKG